MPEKPGLEQILSQVFDGAREGVRESVDPEGYVKRRWDFVFHMTDWRDDLKRIDDLFEHPEHYDEDSASVLVMGFLYHVIPHLNAAGRLLLDEISAWFKTG